MELCTESRMQFVYQHEIILSSSRVRIWSIYQFYTWSSLTEEYVKDDLMSERDSDLD